jgi:hypothetical protein
MLEILEIFLVLRVLSREWRRGFYLTTEATVV